MIGDGTMWGRRRANPRSSVAAGPVTTSSLISASTVGPWTATRKMTNPSTADAMVPATIARSVITARMTLPLVASAAKPCRRVRSTVESAAATTTTAADAHDGE